MKIYHFPPITLNRLVRESVSGFYLRRIDWRLRIRSAASGYR
jgi:hypothetical protein